MGLSVMFAAIDWHEIVCDFCRTMLILYPAMSLVGQRSSCILGDSWNMQLLLFTLDVNLQNQTIVKCKNVRFRENAKIPGPSVTHIFHSAIYSLHHLCQVCQY